MLVLCCCFVGAAQPLLSSAGAGAGAGAVRLCSALLVVCIKERRGSAYLSSSSRPRAGRAAVLLPVLLLKIGVALLHHSAAVLLL